MILTASRPQMQPHLCLVPNQPKASEISKVRMCAQEEVAKLFSGLQKAGCSNALRHRKTVVCIHVYECPFLHAS